MHRFLVAVLLVASACGDADSGPRSAITGSLAAQGLLSVPLGDLETDGHTATARIGQKVVVLELRDGAWRVVSVRDSPKR